MKIENLNTAYKLLIDLNDIDEQKKEIQKVAEILVENETENEFQMSVSKANTIETTDSAIDHGNKLEIKGMSFFSSQSDAYKWIQEQKGKISLEENSNKLDLRISQKVSLQILGLLLSELNEKEKGILQELKAIGVTYKNKRP